MTALKPPFRASDMQGLFRKVQSGIYDPIPKTYSQELKQIISLLLKVDPYRRPSCAQLLNNPMLIRNVDGGSEMEAVSSKVELLQTIYFPKNLVSLKSKLPKVTNL
jgi:NIMA (never in mitosis gene a)-related kinase